jgi:hypothetical protein
MKLLILEIIKYITGWLFHKTDAENQAKLAELHVKEELAKERERLEKEVENAQKNLEMAIVLHSHFDTEYWTRKLLAAKKSLSDLSK